MADYTTSRTLREITRIIASRFWMMLVIFLIPTAAVWVATAYVPKEYRSEVELMTRPDVSADPLTEQQAASLRERISLFVDTQSEVITSDHVLASAALRLAGAAEAPRPFSYRALRAERDEALAELAGQRDEMSDSDYAERRTEIIADYARRRAALQEHWMRRLERWQRRVSEYIEQHPRQVRKLADRVEVVTPGGPEASFTQLFSVRVDWPEEPELAAERGVPADELAARRARQMAQHVVEAYQVRYTRLQAEQTESIAQQAVDIEAYIENREQAQRKLREFVRRPEVRGNLLHLVNMYGRQGGGLETGIASNVRRARQEVDAAERQKSQLRAQRQVVRREAGKRELLARWRQRFALLRKVQTGDPLGDAERTAWNERRAALVEAIRAGDGGAVSDVQILQRGFGELVEEIQDFELVVPDWAAANNPEIRDTQSKTVGLQLALDQYTTSLNYLHEDVLQTAEELLKTWQRLRAKLETASQRVSDEIEVLEARLETTREQLYGVGAGGEGGMEGQLETLEPLAVQYNQLSDEVDRAQNLANEAWKKRLEVQQARQGAPQPILPIVVDGPDLPDPDHPHWPILWLNVLIAAVAGLVLALVYAFLSDHFDHTIKSIDDAERYVGAPVLASIPRLGRRIIRR
ncbi:MAG: hypothetical protein ACOC8F_04840 [Planctomycetota bacterium]